MTRSQITVNASPVADRYGNEKIIEFSSPVGGGLISFVITGDDQLEVHVYRQDITVQVTAGGAGQPVRHGNLRADRALYAAAKAFAADWESRHPEDAEGEAELPAALASRARTVIAEWDTGHHGDAGWYAVGDQMAALLRTITG